MYLSIAQQFKIKSNITHYSPMCENLIRQICFNSEIDTMTGNRNNTAS